MDRYIESNNYFCKYITILIANTDRFEHTINNYVIVSALSLYISNASLK